MENRRTTVVKDKFPKKIDDYDEGYTFLSIGGKLPRIKAPSDGGFEAEDYGDSSTIAPVVGKALVSGVGKSEVDCGRSSTVAGKADDYSSSKYTEEELRMIKEFHSHLNAVGPYDIEMKPPTCLHSPLKPLSLEDLEKMKRLLPHIYEKYILGPAKFALQQINVKEGRDYKFDGIVKFVGTHLQHDYFTIAAKQEMCIKRDMKFVTTDDRATFQAKVYVPYVIGCGSDDYELLEWKRKPDPAAASC